MRYREIVSEDAASDFSSVYEARQIVKRFRAYINRQEGLQLREMPGFYKVPGRIESFLIDASLFDPHIEIDTLKFAFTYPTDGSQPTHGVAFSLGRIGSHQFGVVHIRTSSSILDSYFPVSDIGDDELVHEVQHFFDWLRFDTKEDWHRTNDKISVVGSKAERLRQYYNSPKEMNAYFIQGCNAIFHWARVSPGHLMTHLDRFKDFFTFVKDDFQQEWLALLSEDNRQRFKKRLYKVYVYLKENLPDIDVVDLEKLDEPF